MVVGRDKIRENVKLEIKDVVMRVKDDTGYEKAMEGRRYVKSLIRYAQISCRNNDCFFNGMFDGSPRSG